MTPTAVLVGLPGSGKSSTGRRLAKILAVPFADSDDLIEARSARSIAEIFATDGEAAFRALEQTVIAEALCSFDGVLALGGGALGSPLTRAALADRDVAVVLLRAPLPLLCARVGTGASRPLLAEDPAARLAALAEEREPVYAAAATLSVDTAELSPGQVAARIAARLHERSVRR